MLYWNTSEKRRPETAKCHETTKERHKMIRETENDNRQQNHENNIKRLQNTNKWKENKKNLKLMQSNKKQKTSTKYYKVIQKK